MRNQAAMKRLASIAAVALIALAVVPALASSASAAPTAPGASSGTAASTAWAFGGQGYSSGRISLAGPTVVSWNGTGAVVVIFHATNTSANVTEITVNRTLMVSLTETYQGPGVSWTYQLKALEVDRGYANLTRQSQVKLANGTTVAALGLVNASLQTNASLRASVVGDVGNKTHADYLNVSGWARAQVLFAPSLGLIPLNLTGVTSWSSQATASGEAAWNASWSFVNLGWNGTIGSRSGFISGNWTTSATVNLYGHIAPSVATWVDHRARLAIVLAVSGPFDLYAGLLLVPHPFDFIGGGSTAYAATGVGGTGLAAEYLFVTAGSRQVSFVDVTAANLTVSMTSLVSLGSSGGDASPAAMPAAGSTIDPTVWEQPESAAAAQSQATCLQFGCPGSSNPLGGLVLPLAVAAIAAAVAIGVIVGRRRSGGPGAVTANLPMTPQSPAGPAPPGPTARGADVPLRP